MDTTKQQDLLAAIAQINKKYGSNTVRQGDVSRESEYFSTGFPTLDALIGGGIMTGGFTELIGIPTSGMNTIALRTLASVQRRGQMAIYIDCPRALDPGTAHFCGINVLDLVLVRFDFNTSLKLLHYVVANNIAGLVVFNTLPQLTHQRHLALASTIKSLIALLTLSNCSLMVLSLATRERSLISQYAHLRLATKFDRPLMGDVEAQGYQTLVKVLKHKKQHEGRKISLQIMFDEKMSEETM